MNDLAVNIGVFLAFGLLLNVLLYRDELSQRRLFASLLIASALLLIKFVSLGDELLIISQSVLVVVIVGSLSRAGKTARQETSGVPINVRTEAVAGLAANTGRWRRAWVITPVALLALAIGIAGLAKEFGTPTKGVIHNPTLAKTEATTPRQLTLQGTRFSLTYPEYFTRISTDPPRAPYLEKYELLKRQPQAWDLGIQIESLPSGNLLDDSSYRFRQANPARFSDTTVNVNGTAVHIMADKSGDSGFGRAAFFAHNGLLASLSLSGGSGSDQEQMQTAFMALLNGWQWH